MKKRVWICRSSTGDYWVHLHEPQWLRVGGVWMWVSPDPVPVGLCQEGGKVFLGATKLQTGECITIETRAGTIWEPA